MEARAVIVDMGGGDDLVRARDVEEIEKLAFGGFGRAYDRAEQRLTGRSFFLWRPVRINVINRRRNLAGSPTAQIGEGLLDGREQAASLRVRVRHDGI